MPILLVITHTLLAGYRPHQAGAGRAAELAELGAVEALAQVLLRWSSLGLGLGLGLGLVFLALTLALGLALTLALGLTLTPTLILALTLVLALRPGLTPRECGAAVAGPRRVAGELLITPTP